MGRSIEDLELRDALRRLRRAGGLMRPMAVGAAGTVGAPPGRTTWLGRGFHSAIGGVLTRLRAIARCAATVRSPATD